MWFSNNGYVGVNESCSGLKQFYQIAVLFILFPGPWKHKLWYIPIWIPCDVHNQYFKNSNFITGGALETSILGFCPRLDSPAFLLCGDFYTLGHLGGEIPQGEES